MASGFVNVRRDVDDKFYRYRMPILLTKIEGKGNGIKTVIPNMSDVARALSRPPTYTTKFFGCELGAQTTFDEKNDRYIVNGAHDASRLRELLDAFIEKFVLCKACKNPETVLVLVKNKSEEIVRDCKACGERTSVDMRHKLCTFILKNPPAKVSKKDKAKKGKDGKADANGNGPTEESQAQRQQQDGEGDDGNASDDELLKRIKAEAAELKEESALTKEAWSDTSPDAVKKRMTELEVNMAAASLVGGGGDEEGSDEDVNSPYSQLGRWIEENRDAATPAAIYKMAQDSGIEKRHKTVTVIVQALFTANILQEIPKSAPLLTKMMTSEKHQKALLGGVERLVGISHPDLIPSVPKILMALYQADLIEEDVVTQWGTHVSKKYVDKEVSKKVRKASEPFLKWLEEADDEDDDE